MRREGSNSRKKLATGRPGGGRRAMPSRQEGSRSPQQSEPSCRMPSAVQSVAAPAWSSTFRARLTSWNERGTQLSSCDSCRNESISSRSGRDTTTAPQQRRRCCPPCLLQSSPRSSPQQSLLDCPPGRPPQQRRPLRQRAARRLGRNTSEMRRSCTSSSACAASTACTSMCARAQIVRCAATRCRAQTALTTCPTDCSAGLSPTSSNTNNAVRTHAPHANCLGHNPGHNPSHHRQWRKDGRRHKPEAQTVARVKSQGTTGDGCLGHNPGHNPCHHRPRRKEGQGHKPEAQTMHRSRHNLSESG